jgi:hypothetical protein
MLLVPVVLIIGNLSNRPMKDRSRAPSTAGAHGTYTTKFPLAEVFVSEGES